MKENMKDGKSMLKSKISITTNYSSASYTNREHFSRTKPSMLDLMREHTLIVFQSNEIPVEKDKVEKIKDSDN